MLLIEQRVVEFDAATSLKVQNEGKEAERIGPNPHRRSPSGGSDRLAGDAIGGIQHTGSEVVSWVG